MILWPRTTYNPGHRSSSQTSPSPRWHTRWSSPPTWASHRSSHRFTSSHAGSQWKPTLNLKIRIQTKCPPSVRASCTHFFTFSNEKTTYKNCQTASPHISININEYISQLSFILTHKSGFLHLHSHYNTIILIPSHMGKYLKLSQNFLQTAAVSEDLVQLSKQVRTLISLFIHDAQVCWEAGPLPHLCWIFYTSH